MIKLQRTKGSLIKTFFPKHRIKGVFSSLVEIQKLYGFKFNSSSLNGTTELPPRWPWERCSEDRTHQSTLSGRSSCDWELTFDLTWVSNYFFIFLFFAYFPFLTISYPPPTKSYFLPFFFFRLPSFNR